MASVADLFRLNDGSTYQNTLAQVLQVINQAEQRGVQREGIEAQRSGQAMNYDAKMQQVQSSNAQAVMQDQRTREVEGNKLQYDYANLGERRENNEASRAQEEKKIGIQQQNADTQRAATMGDLFYKGKKDTREQGEYNMKEYDWQEQKANQQTLSKALQEGGVEEYAAALGKLGMTKEFGDALQFLETRKRNTYLNQESYLNSVKTGTEVEVGARMRESYKIATQYTAIAAKDPELADEFLPKALANSKYHQEMGGLPLETVKIMLPSSAFADVASMNKGAMDPTLMKGLSGIFKGFTGAESPFDIPAEPTSEIKNAQAIQQYKVSNPELANLIQQGTKKAPLVQVGPNGEEISPSGKTLQNADQQGLAAGQQVVAQMGDIVNMLKDPDKSKYLLSLEKGKTWAADIATGAIPADILTKNELGQWAIDQTKGSKEVTTKLTAAKFAEVLRIAKSTFTDAVVKAIEKYQPNDSDGPPEALQKAETVMQIIQQANEQQRLRLENGGVDISNDKAKMEYLNNLSPEELDKLEAEKLNEHYDKQAERANKHGPDKIAALAESRGWAKA